MQFFIRLYLSITENIIKSLFPFFFERIFYHYIKIQTTDNFNIIIKIIRKIVYLQKLHLMTMSANEKRMLEREALRSVIQQWNANRLDLFELSAPDEV